MSRFSIAFICFVAVTVLVGGSAVRGSAYAGDELSSERAIVFEGTAGEFADLIEASGGAVFVVLLCLAIATAFGLLLIAGRKNAHNRQRLSSLLAAFSKGKAG